MGGTRVNVEMELSIHAKKVVLCIWWDRKGILYYELLNSGKTVTSVHDRQQLINLSDGLKRKRPKNQ